MAVRGCRDNVIAKNAIKCFLSSIGMEHNGELNVLEVLERTLISIKASSEVWYHLLALGIFVINRVASIAFFLDLIEQ